jgi:hypothetical protein
MSRPLRQMPTAAAPGAGYQRIGPLSPTCGGEGRGEGVAEDQNRPIVCAGAEANDIVMRHRQ